MSFRATSFFFKFFMENSIAIKNVEKLNFLLYNLIKKSRGVARKLKINDQVDVCLSFNAEMDGNLN